MQFDTVETYKNQVDNFMERKYILLHNGVIEENAAAKNKDCIYQKQHLIF